MAIIEVDPRILRCLAEDINAYCAAQEREMRAANMGMRPMFLAGWVGADAREFSAKWAGVNDSDSIAARFRGALENYAQALEACAGEYQSAQVATINEARGFRSRIG